MPSFEMSLQVFNVSIAFDAQWLSLFMFAKFFFVVYLCYVCVRNKLKLIENIVINVSIKK